MDKVSFSGRVNSFVGVIVASISAGATATQLYWQYPKGNLHELTIETTDDTPSIQLFKPNGDIVGLDLSAEGDNFLIALQKWAFTYHN